MTAGENLHATGILLGDAGVLIRGPSGSGKSLLALLLLDRWEGRGLPAQLVADDRVDLVPVGGRLLMRTPQSIAGLIELRGRGVVRRPHVPEASLSLVVDLLDALDRMPEDHAFATVVLGVAVARCPVPRWGATDAQHQLLLVAEALRELGAEAPQGVEKTT